MDAFASTTIVNDRFEIAFSEVQSLVLDFEGVNDYINRSAFLGGKREATIMTGIKLDSSFDGGDIMGQRNFRFFLDDNRRLKSNVKINTGFNTSATTPNEVSQVLKQIYGTTLQLFMKAQREL
ncbi:hypothetical protein [Psychroserpens sp.]|jgi:hypothetical protein|uniref:hypothetical protein n=1 Tax=Psychroserpens sp. TaxID=2020870 RepID=UPI0039E68AE9